jgi:poly(3-hydroxyalkanoate) synthetase
MMSATSGKLTLFVMAQDVCRSLQLLSLKAKTISNKSVHVATTLNQPQNKKDDLAIFSRLPLHPQKWQSSFWQQSR